MIAYLKMSLYSDWSQIIFSSDFSLFDCTEHLSDHQNINVPQGSFEECDCLLLVCRSAPSLAIRSDPAGSKDFSYHLFRSEPAAARILRAEASLKINCVGSGSVSWEERADPATMKLCRCVWTDAFRINKRGRFLMNRFICLSSLQVFNWKL